MKKRVSGVCAAHGCLFLRLELGECLKLDRSVISMVIFQKPSPLTTTLPTMNDDGESSVALVREGELIMKSIYEVSMERTE